MSSNHPRPLREYLSSEKGGEFALVPHWVLAQCGHQQRNHKDAQPDNKGFALPKAGDQPGAEQLSDRLARQISCGYPLGAILPDAKCPHDVG